MPAIAIVGAGFSGVAVAWNLLQQLPPQSRLLLISNEAVIGQGLAYGTPSPHHLLNVPAARMGISAEDEGGFLRYLQQLGLPFQASDFVPRNLYGAYLQRVLGEQRASASARQIEFEIIYDNVIGIERTPADSGHSDASSTEPGSVSLTLRLANSAPKVVHSVVLALGNFAPRPLPYDASLSMLEQARARIVQSPWNYSALIDVPVEARVLLLGSGLTAVDVLLQLRHLGHRGVVTMLSRRGLLAQAHRAAGQAGMATVPPGFVENFSKLRTVRAMLRFFRQSLAQLQLAAQQQEHQASAVADWRDLLAALRPVTDQLWQTLAPAERQRFLRHLQALWDSHRHRMAAPVAARVNHELQQQRLQIRAGRLKHVHYQVNAGTTSAACWHVQWQRRAESHCETSQFDFVINCTGPVSALRSQTQGLLAQLLSRGQICSDAAELGLLIQPDYQVQAADESSALPGLYYIGPLLKAQFWEATAVPELRQHARRLAEHVLASLPSKNTSQI